MTGPYADSPVGAFLSAVASDRVAPSAGAVTALTGAMAAALAEMVCHHTAADRTTARLEEAREGLAARRARLLELADEDATAVDEVHRAFETDTDTTAVAEEQALERATESPVRIADACRDVAEYAAVVSADGTPNAFVDAVVAARIATAAVRAAGDIVRTNCELLDNGEMAADFRRRVADAEATADEALAQASDRLDH
jgi:formiminotetrahydrofolate cyclodeaminase